MVREIAALTRIFGVHNLSLAEDVVQNASCRAVLPQDRLPGGFKAGCVNGIIGAHLRPLWFGRELRPGAVVAVTVGDTGHHLTSSPRAFAAAPAAE